MAVTSIGITRVRIPRGAWMKIHIESKDDIVEATTDARGRVTLGSEYKNSEVQLAILEVGESDGRYGDAVADSTEESSE